MLFRARNFKERVGVIDAGSASAALSIYERKEDLWHPIFSKRLSTHVEEYGEFDRYFSSLLLSLSEISHDAVRQVEGISNVKSFHCFIPSLLQINVVREIRHKNDKPFEVTKKLIRDLVDDEAHSFSKFVHFEYLNISTGTPTVLDKKIISSFLNGYPVEHPLGKHCNEMTLNVFLSYTIKEIIDSLEDTLSKNLASPIEYHSHPLAIYDTARTVVGTNASFSLFDITGEVTDLMFIHNGDLVMMTSFPYGYRTLVRSFSSLRAISTAQAESILSQYKSNHISPNSREKVKKDLLTLFSDWSKTLNSVLEKERVSVIPSPIYVFCPSSEIEFFVSWASSLPFLSGKKVIPFTHRLLHRSLPIFTPVPDNAGTAPLFAFAHKVFSIK